MMSEVEVEHNMVYSDGDGGYLAMEQAHLNYWNGTWGFKGGVVLVPAGIINEYPSIQYTFEGEQQEQQQNQISKHFDS